MILLIDNYDSFTYNLYHYLIQAGEEEVLVKRNDEISIEEIKELNPKGIVLSPGPCTPNEAGICLEVIEKLQGKFPIFGVCLGHQSIGQVFGGKIIKTHPMHGKVDEVFPESKNPENKNLENKNLFEGLPSPFKATRYHSLSIENESFPDDLEITARTKDGIIMGIAHKKHKIFGVQFHPESIASEYGHEIIGNFLKIIS